MGIGSGLGASVGVSKETTYGTYVAPTKFYAITDEDNKQNITYVQGGGLAAGRLARSGSRRTKTNEDASGSLSMDVPNKGFGVFLENLLGTTVTPVQQAATIAYLQTHVVADNFGKKLTLQKGVPQTDGTVKPFTFLGGKATSIEFSCGVGELLTSKIEMDYRQMVESQTLAAPSYTSSVGNWSFKDMTVKVGTYGSEASVDGVTKMTLKIARNMKTDRNYAGNAGLKSEPILNSEDGVEVTGTVEADFLDKAVWADRFAAGTSTSLVWEFVSTTNIASTYYYTIRFTVPMVFMEGDTPVVSGPDVVSGSFPFVARFDDTNSVVTVTYLSTDVTI